MPPTRGSGGCCASLLDKKLHSRDDTAEGESVSLLKLEGWHGVLISIRPGMLV